MSRPLTNFIALMALTAFGLGVACGDDASETETNAASADGGAGGGTTTTDATGGHGGDGGFVPVGSGGSGGDMGCLTTEAEATQSPLDIVVLLDRSSSMSGNVWDSTVNALTQFFNSPGGPNISAAMSYFPAPGNAPECLPASYDPPHVPMSDLTVGANVLVTDLQAQTPSGDYTPTHGGLYGSLLFANDHQDANPDRVVIVVLASDGDPTSCDTDINNIASLAATALAYNGVKTFVIAIQGATLANLDAIAAAGGTMQALDVTQDITQFKAKMDEIRNQILACEFVIPEPSMGMEFDPTKVNVEYTPGNMGTPEQLPQAQDAQDCGTDPGWYYDNNVNPTKIILCPGSCDIVEMDPGAKINFVFGCPTVVN